jgi:hypothetical protein
MTPFSAMRKRKRTTEDQYCIHLQTSQWLHERVGISFAIPFLRCDLLLEG